MRIVKSATVHPDLLTGNAERFWPLVVTAGWTSTDKTRERGEALWSFERGFLNSAFVLACFLLVTFENLSLRKAARSWRSFKKTSFCHRGEEDVFDQACLQRDSAWSPFSFSLLLFLTSSAHQLFQGQNTSLYIKAEVEVWGFFP